MQEKRPPPPPPHMEKHPPSVEEWVQGVTSTHTKLSPPWKRLLSPLALDSPIFLFSTHYSFTLTPSFQHLSPLLRLLLSPPLSFLFLSSLPNGGKGQVMMLAGL